MSFRNKDVQSLEEIGVFDVADALIPFADEVKKVLKCKLGISDTVNHVAAPNQCYVYRDDCPRAMGRIGYGAVQESNSNNFFWVNTPFIMNGRYHVTNSHHHFVMSKGLKKAVTNAKKYLRTLSPAYVARSYWDDCNYDFRQAISRDAQGVRHAKNELSHRDQIVDELKLLYDSGHQFFHQDVADDIAKYVEALANQKEMDSQRTRDILFVYVKPDGTPQAGTFPLDSSGYAYGPESAVWEHYKPVDEISEVAMNRLNALSICEDETYIDLVGYRINQTCFLVYV
jgi:hypothetical protein